MLSRPPAPSSESVHGFDVYAFLFSWCTGSGFLSYGLFADLRLNVGIDTIVSCGLK